MPGFEFRYRLGGGGPTVGSFTVKTTERLSRRSARTIATAC
jgi:hypothetical protein